MHSIVSGKQRRQRRQDPKLTSIIKCQQSELHATHAALHETSAQIKSTNWRRVISGIQGPDSRRMAKLSYYCYRKAKDRN